MKRPWSAYSQDKPWNVKPPAFGNTRHNNPDYHTTRWRVLRKKQLNDYPLCAMCERMGRVTAAVMVDHKISIAEGGDMWHPDNLQSLCNHCHRIKTNKEIAIRNGK